MTEPEDVMPIHLGGEPFLVTRENTSLFTFIGELCEYDHIFISLESIDGGVAGKFIFENSPPNNQTFIAIGEFIMDYEFPMHLNMNEVPGCDRDAYRSARLKEADNVPDYIPEEWKDGEA